MTALIASFTEDHRFLSNFSRVPGRLTALGMTANSAEHIYQAAKTDDPVERMRILEQTTPGRAKKIAAEATMRATWDDIKIKVMTEIIAAKFHPDNHPDLVTKLLDTGAAELVEGNHWGDRFWGVDNNDLTGENHLGRLLMARREQLRQNRKNFS